jgi:hypothetical protein
MEGSSAMRDTFPVHKGPRVWLSERGAGWAVVSSLGRPEPYVVCECRTFEDAQRALLRLNRLIDRLEPPEAD